MRTASGRHVVGAVLVDLVKFIKNHERATGATLSLRAHTRGIVNRRVLPTEWVPIEVFLELLDRLDEIAIRGDEQRALAIGAAGGAAMRGLQKVYGVPGDPMSSVVAMRHAWRAHYDFGRLLCDTTNEKAPEFTVEDFLDMPMSHALMTAGWGIAAARAGGAPDARVTILDRPWKGATKFRFAVHF